MNALRRPFLAHCLLGLLWSGLATAQDESTPEPTPDMLVEAIESEGSAVPGLPPPRYPLDRYAVIWETSPFVIVTDLSGQNDELAGRYVITGFFQVGGKDVVLFFDRTSLERFPLSPGEQRNGLTLQSLQHQGDLNGLRAVLSQGGMTAELRYDPQAVPAVGAPGQVQAQPVHSPPMPPGMPGSPGMPGQPATGQLVPGQAMVGQPVAVPEEQPAPRRIIRRRNIVAPE